MYNKVLLCGHVVEQPKLYKSFCRNFISIIEEYTDRHGVFQSKSVLHPISLGGRLAESFVEVCRKDDLIMIEGKLIWNRYESPQGQEVEEYRILVQNFKCVIKSPV